MPSIAETIRRLQSAQGIALPGAAPPSDRLTRLAAFGSNPGALAGWFYAPARSDAVALVVVLHGCTQTAAAYDHGSGWSDLAERHGFAVLFPEQCRANNPNLCFNWFLDGDTRRDAGEALSIRQMIGAISQRCEIDPARIFVTGLSAGGAMANAMLATYPEVFAGGSIIAGLPYGAAASIPEALERMRGTGLATAAEYAGRVRDASPHAGPWPRVTIWHGDGDRTVDAANADATAAKWRALHGLADAADRIERVDGHAHRVWLGADGRPAVEEYRIAGLGHGTPLKTRGTDSCGNAGAHMLEAGISSTWRQAQSWGLLDRAASPSSAPSRPAAEPVGAVAVTAGVAAVIERALRSAGLR